MTDFEMDKKYTITGRELLALLSLIPDGTEEAKIIKAKVIMKNVGGRGMIEKSRKVNESQIDFLDSCPFCGGEVELRDKFDGTDETSFFHCTKCHMWFEKFVWRGYGHAHIIEEWNERVN